MGISSVRLRTAVADDAEAIARLVNRAYEVERFFVDGDRTSAAEVRRLLDVGAVILAVDHADRPMGCIHVQSKDGVGHFGMLAVDASARGQGLARRLIDAAEGQARDAGAAAMEIDVVNLRSDLFPLYEKLGYARIGTAPYVRRPISQPCHFVVMSKRLS